MQTQTTYLGTPNDLEAALNRVIVPLIERIQQIEFMLQPTKSIYTVNQLAELLSYSPQMIRRFICKGKQDRKGKLIFLKAKEITNGDYRITATELQNFLSHF